MDHMTETHLITDSHCHLDFPDFEGDLPDLLARASAAGVHRLVTICTKLKNEPAVRALARRTRRSFTPLARIRCPSRQSRWQRWIS